MVDAAGSPLVKKLGIAEGDTVGLVGVPPTVRIDVPSGVTVRRQARGRADVVVAFFVDRRAFEQRIETFGRMIFPSGGLWVAWPKRSSGLASAMSDHVVREIALPLGLVDNKVCAIDENWTALRLAWRRERRETKPERRADSSRGSEEAEA